MLALVLATAGCMTRQPPAQPSTQLDAQRAGDPAPAPIPVVVGGPAKQDQADQKGKAMSGKIQKTDEEWRAALSPQQFQVLRQKGTERAFTGAFWNEHRKGVYLCAACGQELFRSDEKFDSGTGWPSFTGPAANQSVETETDEAYGMRRVEVHRSRCGGHLGHVFDDGPRPTGMRYCINSASLKFEEQR